MTRRPPFAALLFVCFVGCVPHRMAATAMVGSDESLADLVDPFVGATTQGESAGKTFPGATTPFGLVQLSPDTVTGGDNASGYSWEHDTIEGFSFTHLSGVGWYGDFGNLLVTPTLGPLRTSRAGYRSRFRHESESAAAGYYAVTLDDPGVRVELTALPHTGMMRFTFPPTTAARVQIDLARRIGGTSTEQLVRVVDEHTIEGWMDCSPEGGGWGDGVGGVRYRLFFAASFSASLTRFGAWSAEPPDPSHRHRRDVESTAYQEAVARAKVIPNARELQGKHIGFFAELDTRDGAPLLLKAGLSFVDAEGARANLHQEMAGWDFEGARRAAHAMWSSALDAIAVVGGQPSQRRVFATALYHSLMEPRGVTDVDGRYRAADQTIAKNPRFTSRTIFSGWDVFRGEMPLLTLIEPNVVNDEVNSLVEQATRSGNGYLPRWEIMGSESGCMLGDPAVSVIAEAYLKNIRGFDADSAYAACRQTLLGPKTNRAGWQEFAKVGGFVPDDLSSTLENAYFDHAGKLFARALHRTADEEHFSQTEKNYRSVYDPSVHGMRARHADGRWMDWQGRTTFEQGTLEANPWQQGWFVPHDVGGLIDLMGGKDAFVADLEEFFERSPKRFGGMNELYNQSNEPDHHVAYLFVHAGAAWRTQRWVSAILTQAYGLGPAGLVGNDDVGQMSAWYVLSAMGFYPVSPVDGVYIIGSPVFDEVTMRLDPRYYPGGTFRISAHRQSPGDRFIHAARLNGVPMNRAWLTHDEITRGGALDLDMQAEPDLSWGNDPVPVY